MSYSGLTPKQIVTQSTWCHPDWDVDTHIAYLLHEEGVNLEGVQAPGCKSIRETINRWKEEALRTIPR